MNVGLGLVCCKRGMSRVFLPGGDTLPVSVVEVLNQRVVQVKDAANDGYLAAQVTYGYKHSRKISKPLQGHYKKANTDAGLGLYEFRLDAADQLKVGDEVKASLFKEGQMVDVSGITRGKGFAGTIKRHHFTMGDATHGNSLSHRAPGSIGQRQSPGRVFKGKKMSGRMGATRVTVQNLEVVRVLEDKNLLLIKGAIPGAPGSVVVVKSAVKGTLKNKEHQG